MVTRYISGTNVEDFRKSFQKSVNDGFKPTLGLVFSPNNEDIESTCSILEEANVTIFGYTSFFKTYHDVITDGKITALLFEIATRYFTVFFEEHDENNVLIVAEELAIKASKAFKKPNILFGGSYFALNYGALLNRFKKVLGKDVNLFGALSIDENDFYAGLTFTNKQISSKGLMLLVFDAEKIDVEGQASSGWKSAGTVKTITKSDGNRIYELDDTPVLDITAKYAGIEDLPKENFEATMLVSRTLSMNFLQEKSEPITIVGVVETENSSMITQAECTVGKRLRFALPPEFEVVEESVWQYKKLKERVGDPDAVILFSCANRLDVLGPLVEDEVNNIRSLWDAPFAGFMSNGEIGRYRGGELNIHNCTNMLVTIKEIV